MTTGKEVTHCPVKVSVCVVTYNQEKYIDECLDSIVTQYTNFKFEVIVSDDGSTDRTREIIRCYASKYPDIVVPVFREKNLGALKNFVETHSLARGDYVCHCDGDDRWLPGKLQAQADFLDANSDFSVVWGRMNLFDDAGKFCPGEQCDYSMFDNGVVTFSQALSYGSIAIHSSIMYRSAVRITKMPAFEVIDLFYTWEFLSCGNGKIMEEIVGEYRVASHNAISSNLGLKLKKLYYTHAVFFFEKYPVQRKSIFMFSFINFIVDVKNGRKSSFLFLKLMMRTFVFVGLVELYRHIKVSRKLITRIR